MTDRSGRTVVAVDLFLGAAPVVVEIRLRAVPGRPDRLVDLVAAGQRLFLSDADGLTSLIEALTEARDTLAALRSRQATVDVLDELGVPALRRA